MDETTVQDIRKRVARWQRDFQHGSESERTWIFAINIDDVNLLLHEIEGMERQIADLHEQLQAARQYLPAGGQDAKES